MIKFLVIDTDKMLDIGTWSSSNRLRLRDGSDNFYTNSGSISGVMQNVKYIIF